MKKELKELTLPQKNIMGLEQYYKGTNINNITTTLRFDEMNTHAMSQALKFIIKNCETLHLLIDAEGEETGLYRQYFKETMEYVPEIREFDHESDDNYRNFMEEFIKQPLNIYECMFDFKIVKFKNQAGILFIKMHHLISDAWSQLQLEFNITECYEKVCCGDFYFEFAKSYKDYLDHERKYIEGKRYDNDKKYWEEQLGNHFEPAVIRAGFNAKEHTAKRFSITLDQKQEKLFAWMRERLEISPYTLYMGLISTYASRVMRMDDIAIGTPVLNRSNISEKKTVGVFINTIPLVLHLSSQDTFQNICQKVALNSMHGFKHQRYPFAKMQEIARNRSGMTTIYDILVSYQNIEIDQLQSEWLFNGINPQQLSVHISNYHQTAYRVDYDYQTALYDERDIQMLHEGLFTLLEDAKNNPDKSYLALEILSDQEKNLISKFNDTEASLEGFQDIGRMFSETARKYPQHTAVISEEQLLSYEELDSLSNRIANAFRERGIVKGDIVAMMLPRNKHLLPVQLGILKAGAAYLPIDIEFPEDRIKYILSDSDTKFIVTENEVPLKGNVTCAALLSCTNTSFPDIKISGTDLCYMIYTSGSTGKPKGTMLMHKNVYNYCMYDRHNVYGHVIETKECTILSVTTISFDIFVTESLLPLTNGMTVLLAGEDEANNGSNLKKLLEKYPADLIQTTPSKMGILIHDENDREFLKKLKKIVLGGEAIDPSVVRKIKQCTEAEIYNIYGPTETTVWSSVTEPLRGDHYTIGRPIANTQIYIVDENKRMLPIGCIGELGIAGEGVCKGYYERPDLTEEKFVENPFGAGKMYDTGDFARWNPDGELEFMGRADGQIKLHGLRIELGEIENCISAYEGIDTSAAVVRGSGSRSYICGFFTSARKIDLNDLKKHLSQSLTYYMVPNLLVQLDEMPYTNNGKIARNLLPDVSVSEEMAPLETAMEKTVFNIVADSLGTQVMGATTDLFVLGMTSLDAIRISSAVSKKIGTAITAKDVLSHHTIRQLSRLIEDREKDVIPEPHALTRQETYPLTTNQMGLYMQFLKNKDAVSYNLPIVYRFSKNVDSERLIHAIKAVIDAHPYMKTYFKEDKGRVVAVRNDEAKPVVTRMHHQQAYQNFVKPFDLFAPPLYRIKVYAGEEETLIYFDIHHMIFDGGSAVLFMEDLRRAYQGEKLEKETDYFAYAVYESGFKSHRDYTKAKEYYMQNFQDAEVFSQVLPDVSIRTKAGKNTKKNKGELSIPIRAEWLSFIESAAKECSTTPMNLLMSSFCYVISKLSGNPDIIIGTVENGRDHQSFAQAVGMMVKTLPFRAKIDESGSIMDLVDQVKKNMLDAMRYDCFTMPDFVETFRYEPEILFIYQNIDFAKVVIGDEDAQILAAGTKEAKYALSFSIENGRLLIEYEKEKYTEKYMHTLAAMFMKAGEEFAKNMQEKLKNVELISESDVKSIDRLNNTAAAFDETLTVCDLFDQAVKMNPEKPAIYCGDAVITFEQMDDMTDSIAGNLSARGIGRGDIVSVCMKRSEKLLCVMMGILKSGAAFLPMDMEWPAERQKYMHEDSDAKLCIDDGLAEILLKKTETLKTDMEKPKADDLCYIIYTSGSTGKPKGGMITHQNLVNFCLPLPYNRAITEACNRCQCSLAIANMAFDASIHETIATYVNGISVAFADEKTIDSPKLLARFIKKTKAECIVPTPSRLMQYLKDKEFSDAMKQMKMIISAAEAYPQELFEILKKNKDTVLLNGYGPSETSIGTSYSYVTDQHITIGTPISNVQMYILDAYLNRLPVGVAGELCISGANVGLGYLKNQKLTKEKFVTNPFGRGNLYRTGDYARLGYCGEVEFCGRMDDQVKLHGLRIEIGEIETVIKEYASIENAVVVVSGEADQAFLCGYFTASDKIDPEALRDYLQERLTYYMVPNRLIQLEKMPLNPNGKLDYKALKNVTQDEEFVAYSNEVQKSICDVISEVLGMNRVGIKSDLYRLGMTSLHAIRMNQKICALFDIELNSKQILRCNTVEKIEKLVNAQKKTGSNQEVSSGEKKECLLMMHQMGLYYEYMKEPDSLAYNIPVAYSFDAAVDAERLKEALICAVKAHPSMNSYIREKDGKIVLVRNDEFKPEITIEEYSDQKIKQFVKPFDLKKAPLYRIAIYTGQDKVYLLFDVHHIIFDGESMKRFFGDVKNAYENNPVTKESYSAFDYAVYEQKIRKSDKMNTAKEFYRKMLQGWENVSSINPDLKSQDSAAGLLVYDLGSDMGSNLKRVAEEYKLTVNSVYMTGFMVALAKFVRNTELTIVTVESGRDLTALENSVGMFVKTLPMRYTLDAQETFRGNAGKVQDLLYGAMEHDCYSYSEISSDYKLNAEIMFVFQLYGEDGFVLGNYPARPEKIDFGITPKPKFPISFSVVGNEFQIEYDRELYLETTMAQLASAAANCLRDVVHHPHQQLAKIEIISNEDKEIIKGFNATETEFDAEATIVSKFREQAVKNGNHPAVVASDRTLTYKELDEASNRVAHALIKRGVACQDIVTIKLSRTSKLFCAVFGILKAGAAYLPIDINYPRERVEYVLTDSKAAFMVDDDNVDELLSEDNSAFPNVNVRSDDLCYVIYTSGSTGKPKGVMTEHRNVLSYSLPSKYNDHINTICDQCQVSLAIGSFSFDIAVAEIYPFLFAGKTVVFADEKDGNDTGKLTELIKKNGVDAILCTPSRMLQFIKDEEFARALSGFHSISAAGEAVPYTWVERMRELSAAKLYNGYGPTETTAGSTFLEINHDYINIGKPLSNEKVYVLDAYGNQLPIGVAGELCISGHGVARGYLYKEELTAEKFVPNPYGAGRMYRTGDLAKWNDRGEIEFIGRIDEQVKFHGYRIEPGEIEARMSEYPLVRASAVIVRTKGDQQYLYGYYTADGKLEPETVKSYLSETLAYYMVPHALMQLDEMPLNLNAKIDKRALPDIEFIQEADYVEPQSEAEIKICSVFSRVLGNIRIGLHDNFFEKGGDSLNSIHAVSLAAKEGMIITARDMMKYPTPFKLVKAILERQTAENVFAAEQGELKGEVISSPIQGWFFERKFVNPDYFNQSFLFEAKEELVYEAVGKTLKMLLKKHDALRLRVRNNKLEYIPFERAAFVFRKKRNVTDFDEVFQQAQEALSLKDGKLLSAVLFTDTGKINYLFITIHHMAVDGVSWGILKRDLEAFYKEIEEGKQVENFVKTASVRQWNSALKDYAQTIPDHTVRYWHEALETSAPFPSNIKNRKTASFKEASHKTILLSQENTQLLIKKGTKHFGARANEVLLGTLVSACREVNHNQKFVINLEGHGREYIGQEIDLSQTVGWFTSLYPFVIPYGENSSIAAAIHDVKNKLRSVPDHGISFGVLRYMTDRLKGELKRGISFNYLGTVGDGEERDSIFKPAEKQPVYTIDINNEMTDDLSVNAVLKNGRLTIQIDFDANAFEKGAANALCTAFKNKLHELAALLKDSKAYYPLLKSQMGIYLSCVMQPESLNYNEPSEYVISDKIDAGKLVQSFEQAIKAHPSMMVNILSGAEPVQFVNENNVPKIPYLEMTPAEYEHYKKEFVRPFNLSDGPLYRVAFVHVEDQIRILFDVHHIIYDRTSAAVLIETINQAYKGETMIGETAGCFDAAVEEQHYVGTYAYKQAKEFFHSRFSGLDTETVLPPDHNPKRKEKIPCASDVFVISKEVKAKAERFGKEQGLTENAVFLSALNLCLSKYTYQKKVVLGTVGTGRDEEKYFNSVGMFVKTFPLIQTIHSDDSVLEFMKSTQDNLMQTLSYDFYTFTDLVDDLGFARADGRNPVFDILYVFQNTQEAKTSIADIPFEIHEISKPDSKFDLTFMVLPGDNGEIVIEYNADMYENETISAFVRSYEYVLEHMIDHQDANLETICMADQSNTAKIAQFNATEKKYDSNRHVPKLIEELEKKHGDKVILTTCEEKLTVKELNARANRVAHALMDRGIKRNDAVALLLPKSASLVTAMLGVIRAGAAYLPLDIEYPKSRVEYILEDVRATYIITDEAHAGEYEAYPSVCVSDLEKYHDETFPEVEYRKNDIFCLLHTSGSTGKPKGTMLSFGNFSNFVQANSVLLDGLTCAVAATTVTFDAFAMDIFLPLSNGLPVILASEDECMDQIKLEKLLENNPNCYLFMTPTRLMELLKNRINQKIMENVSMMIVGGEIFSGELYQLIRASGKNTKIVNIYGPTETTIFATSREVNTDRGINIGSPAANTKIHILDQDGLSVPVGAIGELYIAGDGVGLGYRNNETLTKERYLDNPYGKGKIYRTGDMAKWNRKGSIDFLGRIDTQVKFHGQRIELGEIENCMNSYEGITASSVMVRERGSESFLCGYFTSKIPVSPEKLKEYLGERLTYYMVPAVLVPLEEMPHTTSGKIDRKALPDVAFKAEVLACETELQEKLQYMVKRVIGLDEIGRNTDLYSCGMTSLSAIRINTLIAQELGYELKTKDILKHPTIEQLEALILSATPRDSDRQQPITAAENGAAQYPLTANQLGLYLEYEKDVQAINYNIPMLYTFDRSIDASKLRNAIYEALEAHPYLNTCLKETEGGMVQIPNQRTEDIPILKMSRTQLKEYMKGFVRPFNLFAAPLYRMAVIETKEALYLCFDIHHIIYDGESSAIFMESVSRAPRQERSSYVPQQERSSYVPRQ